MRTLNVMERKLGERVPQEAWASKLLALAERAERIDPQACSEQELAGLVIEGVNLMWLGMTPGIIANSARASAISGTAVWLGRPTPADADATDERKERFLAARAAAAQPEQEPEPTEAKPEGAPAEAVPGDDTWLTTSELAERLGLAQPSVYAKLRNTDLPPELVLKEGRGRLYAPKVIELIRSVSGRRTKVKPEPAGNSAALAAEPEENAYTPDPAVGDEPKAELLQPEPESEPQPPAEADAVMPEAEPEAEQAPERLTPEQRSERKRLCMARHRERLKVEQRPPQAPEATPMPAAVLSQLEALLAQIKGEACCN